MFNLSICLRNKGRGRQCNQPTIIPKLCAMKTSVPEVLRDAPLKRGSMAILICEMLLIIYFWWVTLPTNLLKYRRIFLKKKWEKGSRGLKVVKEQAVHNHRTENSSLKQWPTPGRWGRSVWRTAGEGASVARAQGVAGAKVGGELERYWG